METKGEITGKFNQVQTTPENWSGPPGLLAGLGTRALAVWAAGLVTASLVY